MDQERLEKYYKLMEEITDMTCRYGNFDREKFVALLREFCEMFRLSKGVTEFYKSVRMEEEGKGEILVDFDNGKEGVPIIQLRICPPSGVVIKGTLYMSEDEEPLSEIEREKVEMVYRLVMSFISRNRLQKTVEIYAFTDEDGFYNRRSLMRFIDRKIVAGEQYGYCATCINLKNFTAINQEIGRKAGDIVMKEFYEFLKGEIGEDAHICRLGGDNFILFFRNELRDKILDDLAGTPIVYDKENDRKVTVSARAGIYVITEDVEVFTPTQIMDRVYPVAMMAKQRGLDVLFYDKELIRMRDHANNIRKMFAEALEKKEIVAYYQPKVDVNTGEVVGAEALCRWFRDGKIVMPMEFIPILETNMDICELDFYMFETVCADIRRWIDEGRRPPRVSVNFSRKHLNNPDLLGYILGIINRYEVQRKFLEIELTETTSDVEFNNLNRIVTGLHREGIRTSVDDFGNGYSSLNLIRAIPWDVVKIDRSLLPMDDDSEEGITNRMYKHVVSMAVDIGLECVTEGVETKKQVNLLKENKCPIAQGFYFDRPLPVEEFEKRLYGTPYFDKL